MKYLSTTSYSEAVEAVAEHVYESKPKDLDLEFELGENNYDVWVYGGEIHVCKSTIDALTDGTYGDGSSSCPELKILFEKDVDRRVKELEEVSRWGNYEDTFTDNDWYMQTVGYTHYAGG